MASTQHYMWAGGHLVMLLSAVRYLFAYATWKSASYAGWYKTSFFGALISYAIVCHKALGTPVPTAGFIQKALTDENIQYFLLALFWWFSKPIPIALFPYTVFSLFHALTFLRTTVLPIVIPPPPSQPGATPSTQEQSSIAKAVQRWVKANYDNAMRLTAYAELIILLRVTLGALTFQNSILSPFVYAYFLKHRYLHSPFTRDAVFKTKEAIDYYATRPSVTPKVNQIWEIFKRAVRAWVGNTPVPQPAAGAAGRRATTSRE